MNRKAPIQPRTIKMFLNCLNSWTSNFIIEQFRTDHTPEAKIKYEFIGLMDQSGNELPKYLTPEIIQINYNYLFQESLFNADVIVYNLNEGDTKEIEYIIAGLNKLKIESEKILIIISSIMTWANTPIKESSLKKESKTDLNNQTNDLKEIKEQNQELEKEAEDKAHSEEKEKEKEKEEKGENEEGNIDMNDEQQQQQQQEAKLIIEEEDMTVYYSEEEYLLRKPHIAYLQYNLIENRAMEIKNPNIKTYIICPGFFYGKGEQIFYDYFKMSWLNNPIQLISQGNNTIPTIYIEDFVLLLKRVIDKKPAQRYILGVDHTKDKTLKGIMTAISQTIGNGQVSQLESFDINSIDIPHFEEMGINVKVKPSQLFFDERRENEDKEDYEKRSFKWNCQYGIAKNIEKIQTDFLQYKQLTTLRVIVLGMPYSGKTLIAKKLSTIFKLPYINIGDIIKWGKEELDDDLNKEVLSTIEEMASKLKEEEEAYNKRTNKKKTDPPFDPYQASKLPIELVVKLLQHYIKIKNECFTHGFILDGFPRTYNEACLFHLDSETKEPLSELLPHNVIMLDNCTEEFVSNRMKESKEYQTDLTPNPIQERMTRRLLRYKDTLEKEISPNTLEQFYRDRNVEIMKIDITTMISTQTYNKKEVMTICKDFLLQSGEYMKNCFHLGYNISRIQEEEEEGNEGENKEERENAEGEKANKDTNAIVKSSKIKTKLSLALSPLKEPSINSNSFLEDNAQEEAKEVSIEKPKDKLEEQKEKDQQLLEKKSEVLRRYLAENVIGILSKGILAVSKAMPDDPVEALANFLLETKFEKDNKGNLQEEIKMKDNAPEEHEEAEDKENKEFIEEANQLIEASKHSNSNSNYAN